MEAPRRLIRTNRFKFNRNGRKEEGKKVVKPKIIFKVDPKDVAPVPAPIEIFRPRYPRSRRRARAYRPQRYYSTYYYQAPVSPKPTFEDLAEKFMGQNGFPCGHRKCGKSAIGKKVKPPQHARRPWRVKLAQSSQNKKRKHKRSWKRRGQDIDFGL